MEVCVLHKWWEKPNRQLCRCSYVLLEREMQGKTEYLTYCILDEERRTKRSEIVPIPRRLAKDYSEACALLALLAKGSIRPVHYADVLFDFAI